MMDPDSGDMRMLTADEIKALAALNAPTVAALDAPTVAALDAPTVAEAFPGRVLWREGEELEVRGCWFRVSAVRRTRITLIPIPRPKP